VVTTAANDAPVAVVAVIAVIAVIEVKAVTDAVTRRIRKVVLRESSHPLSVVDLAVVVVPLLVKAAFDYPLQYVL
jgi:hypothetical protein